MSMAAQTPWWTTASAQRRPAALHVWTRLAPGALWWVKLAGGANMGEAGRKCTAVHGCRVHSRPCTKSVSQKQLRAFGLASMS